MKLGIMQPYFMPYLGYWQLMNAVDKYVLLDDANYIMRGFINRNSILLNGKAHMFSIPIHKASQNKLINETELNFEIKDKENLINTLSLAYKKAPYYNDFFPILKDIILFDEKDLVKYIKNSIEKIAEYSNIKTEILISSKLNKNHELKSQERIIEINKVLNSSVYINAIGGVELYDKKDFNGQNIELKFIKTLPYEYKQFKNDFVPNLSVIDVLMFNSKEDVKKLLDNYELI